MRHLLSIVLLCIIAQPALAEEAKPLVLFNGKDLAGWKLREKPKEVLWKAVSSVSLDPKSDKKLVGEGAGGTADAVLLRGPGAIEDGVDLISEQTFGDMRVQLEFLVPKDGNSGLFLQGQYEVQITDSFGTADDKVGNGDCGGVTWVSPPKTNACLKPGAWQSLDVVFRAPRFDDKGKKTQNAVIVSVILNGKKVQENLELKEPTGSELDGGERAKGPIMLQGNEGMAAYRNIRVTPM